MNRCWLKYFSRTQCRRKEISDDHYQNSILIERHNDNVWLTHDYHKSNLDDLITDTFSSLDLLNDIQITPFFLHRNLESLNIYSKRANEEQQHKFRCVETIRKLNDENANLSKGKDTDSGFLKETWDYDEH